MTTLEELLAIPEMAALAKEQRPVVEHLFKLFIQASNTGVESCIDLVEKWGAVKQLTNTEDFKLLLEYMRKNLGTWT